MLSIDQACALQQFEDAQNLFITGEGGTGKTLLIKHLVQSALKRNKRLQVCAMTGCAAVLLGNARTIHSWSGLYSTKGERETLVQNILYRTSSSNAWKNIDILIVDEVSMMSKRFFDLLNEIGKRVRRNSAPFGGIQIVLTGDFYQLPPVADGDIDSDKFCFESVDWPIVFSPENHIVLNTVFRQVDPVYKRVLSNIRKGIVLPEDTALLCQYVHRPVDNIHGCVPTKLFPKKYQVDVINQKMYDALPGQSYEYGYVSKTDYKVFVESNKNIPLAVLEKCRKLPLARTEKEIEALVRKSPLAPILPLKKGANVMCIANLDIDKGICNGAIGVVVDFSKSVLPVVRFSNGVTREIAMKYWQSEEYPTIVIGQLPLCLAWAMTIHKIQGATLSMAEMDIGNGIFEYGQSYVALSRVKDLQGLYLSGFDPAKIRAHPAVQAFYDAIPDVEYLEEEEQKHEQKQEQKEQNFAQFEFKEISYPYV